jgi:hypothetical protein
MSQITSPARSTPDQDRDRQRQDDPEQYGEPVQPPGGRGHPHRIIGVGQGERRVLVREQPHVGENPARPPKPADQEVSQAIGQPAGEQGGEPADDRHDLNGDAERVEHDVVRNHQQRAEQHGDPPLPPGAGEGRQDLIARPEDWCRGRGYPGPQRYFSHFAAPFFDRNHSGC